MKWTQLIILFSLIPLSVNAQVQIGDGEETEDIPVDPYYVYTYSQTIYLKSEIGNSGGDITTLQYYFDGEGITNTNEWTIYMGHTSKTSFSSSTDWIPVSQLTEVYSGSIPNPGTSGWITLDIDDFTYNGTDHLVIAVDENQDDYDGSGRYFFCTSVDSERSIVYTDDYDNPVPTSPPDGYTEDYIPNIILGGIVYERPTVSTVEVTSKTRTSATIKGNITDLGIDNPTAYGVCWDTTESPSIADNYTDEGSVSSIGEFSSEITGLTASKRYYARAYAINSVGISYGNEIDFATVYGSGTEDNPYQISTVQDLKWMSEDYSVYRSDFVQTADIDASATGTWNPADLDDDPDTPATILGFSPIGYVGIKFTGTYDGQGHTISNLFIDRPLVSETGLFGEILNATIKNLGLVNVTVKGARETGALVGKVVGYSTIQNCYVTGTVGLHIRSIDQGSQGGIGGLVGYNYHSDILNCYSEATVVGHDNPGGLAGYRAALGVGGLVGYNVHVSTIKKCYSTGDIDGGPPVGGLVGGNGGNSIIENSYSRGDVLQDNNSNTPATEVGGFCGISDDSGIQYCYSTGQVGYTSGATVTDKGFLGSITPNTYNADFSIYSNFWDTETSGQSSSAGSDTTNNEYPLGKTTGEMKSESTFTEAGWGFANTWAMNSSLNDGYPHLSWETDATDIENNIAIKPQGYSLSQNYPNPFNPTTTIRYALPEKSVVNIVVFNTRGETVRTLVQKTGSAGYHTLEFNAGDLSSGMYFYRIQAKGFTETRKMILLK